MKAGPEFAFAFSVSPGNSRCLINHALAEKTWRMLIFTPPAHTTHTVQTRKLTVKGANR
jgi:hypothetical protein